MKKRLICFLILSSFIIGLVFVGSCKDYDDFALDIRVQNLEIKGDSTRALMYDSLAAIRQALGKIKQCNCDPTLKRKIDSLYNYLGDVLGDTCSIDTAPGQSVKGIGKIINYLNKQLTLMAAEADLDNLKARIDTLYKDSIKPSYDDAKWVADSLRNNRFGIGDSIKRAWDSAAVANALARENQKAVTALRNRTNDLADSLKKAYDSISALKDSVKNHLGRIEGLEQEDVKLNRLIDSLEGVTSRDSVRIQELIAKDAAQDKRIDSLAKVTYDDSIRTKQYFDRALFVADSIGDTIRAELYDSIDKVVKAYQAADAQIWAVIKPMRDSIQDAYDSIAAHRQIFDDLFDSIAAHRQIFDDIFDSIADHRKLFNEIFDSIAEIRVRLDSIEARVDTLELAVDSLKDAREKNISGIDIQGTRNDVFGTFALPVDLRSNILMTYYSDFPGAKFPSVTSTLKGSAEITAKDWAVIKSAQESLGSGRVVEESSDNAGKLYFTLNPNDVKIDDTYEFYLMTSDGIKTPVALSNIQKSTEKLTFGLSTGLFVNGQVVENNINTVNGFYQADAKIEAADAYSLRPYLDVDKEELKAVALDVKNYKDGVDLKGMASTLINTVLRSTDGILDANALYVSWSDAYGKHSATSKYNVAAFAVKPLSYNTFNSLSLPDIDIPANPIDYLITRLANKAKSEVDKYTISFKKIKLSKVEFSMPDIKFDSLQADRSVIVYIKAENGFKDTIKIPFESSYMNTRTAICQALQDVMDVLEITEDDMDDVVNNMRQQIQKQTNDILSSIEGSVHSKLKTVIGDIATEVGNNKYIKKLETLASKMSSFYNKYSDGFGRYLVQPMLLYLDDSGDLHPMSRSMTVPTPYSTNSIDLIMTSLTNEIVTPAYKKFVAVTNYIDPVTFKDYQNDGDDAAKSVITGINGNGEIGVVLDGSTKSVTFNAPQKGTYELLLSTIDYDGYVFNRKFYVTVK